MENDFISWLTTEIDRRGWTNTETARRAGVVQSTISLTISRKSRPGIELCRGLARAFNIPPEEVYRRAGLLPPLPDEPDHAQERRLYDLYRRLPERVRERVVEYAAFEYERLARGKEQAPDE
jgi:transcriptional regulator with XRE-family HTH domain